MAVDIKKLDYLFGGNAVFVEEMYQIYLQDPSKVDETWQNLFKAMEAGSAAEDYKFNASWAKIAPKIIGVANDELVIAGKKEPARETQGDLAILAHMVIRAYRTRGHLLADLDPLMLEERKTEEQLHLNPGFYGINEADLDKKININGEVAGINETTIRELCQILKSIYSSHIGAEFMHIQSLEEKQWIQGKIESLRAAPKLNAEQKKEILKSIIAVEGFEQYLHVKFPGTKRFSVEGGETSITAMEAIVDISAKLGVNDMIIGMAHRGRLNVLTKVMGKPYHAMISEVMGNPAHPEELGISGDVKYHLGTSSDKTIHGQQVHLSLTPNPSHLECVNAVVVGKVRAKQDLVKDTNREKVLGILVHGDAAFAGQGIVAETLCFGDLAGYTTGGTAHIIVNNQIGFTTSPKKARASRYPTEFGKIVQAPIFHVNGDDPEAVIYASQIAAEFRAQFKKDVIIDVFCYRQYGHNETDEPMFTQPLMYKAIAARQTPVDVYANQLIREGVITQENYETMKQEFRTYMETQYEKAKSYKVNDADWMAGKWSGFIGGKTDNLRGKEITGMDLAKLKEIGHGLAKEPENFAVNSKILRVLEAKKKMMDTGEGLDWAMGEALGYGSLLVEGTQVRLSGQDCGRGTFSHRHSVLMDQNTEAKYVPLNNLAKTQANFEVLDSNLSEFGVLGFEYGYSTVEPNSLTLWEGQFGDFANGAQVIFDQFISSAEIKWLRSSGIVVLLPHGMEGQGPEHSSARLERYLQLCAEDNMQVVNITTPANFFHVLRRQIHRNFRKPLIVMSPKSLLRHKLAISSLSDMGPGTKFLPVIADSSKLAKDADVKRVVLCSGKVYYDLFEERQKRNIDNIALVRVEEMYPFPAKELTENISKYKNADVIWCQEESKNQGAWHYISEPLEALLLEINNKCKRPSYVGRAASASPATGYGKVHAKEQSQLVDAALSL